MRLVVLLQARNEERYLPDWLANVGDLVDGIIALDDGSTDRTADLLGEHPKLVELLRNEPGQPWDERTNQNSLVQAARRHGAEWILCLDADERLEHRFVEGGRALLEEADRRDVQVFGFGLRECWDSPHQYRVDGMWGQKVQYRLFRNNPAHRMFDPRPIHRTWMPLELFSKLKTVARHCGHNIYHLRMINPADRDARVARYEALDPDNTYQSIGYRYLTDETGLVLQPISSDRRYLPYPTV